MFDNISLYSIQYGSLHRQSDSLLQRCLWMQMHFNDNLNEIIEVILLIIMIPNSWKHFLIVYEAYWDLKYFESNIILYVNVINYLLEIDILINFVQKMGILMCAFWGLRWPNNTQMPCLPRSCTPMLVFTLVLRPCWRSKDLCSWWKKLNSALWVFSAETRDACLLQEKKLAHTQCRYGSIKYHSLIVKIARSGGCCMIAWWCHQWAYTWYIICCTYAGHTGKSLK